MNIGEKIRGRRNALGLSLRDLGSQTGLTASFLSQVENGQVSPSLNSLQSIASALNEPMFSLLDDTPSGNVVREADRRRFTFEEPHITYELLTPDFSRQMMAYIIRIKAHSKRIAQKLVKPTEQWMNVISGNMRIVVGDQEYLLNPGDTISYDGDLLVEFGSVSDEELRVICCITPPVL